MNKNELIEFIAESENCSKIEAERVISSFTNGIINAISQGNEISLVGFGNFSVSRVEAREGISPKTKEPLQIEAYNQVRSKVGQKLKSAANGDKNNDSKNKNSTNKNSTKSKESNKESKVKGK